MKQTEGVIRTEWARIDLEYWEWLCGKDGILFELELDFGEQEGFQQTEIE